MLGAGALEEVAALAARKLDPLLPAMKAHGVPVLIRHLNGEITREQAAEIGRADTRHYAKRQFTWFRHQLPEFEWVNAGGGEGVGGGPSPVARMTSDRASHGCTHKIPTRRTAGTPLSCKNRAKGVLPLTSGDRAV